jgi:hypothetical protein
VWFTNSKFAPLYNSGAPVSSARALASIGLFSRGSAPFFFFVVVVVVFVSC